MRPAQYQLFSLGSNPELANSVAKSLNMNLSTVVIQQFADDEIYERIESTVRGRDIYVIQSLSDPVNDNFMKLMVFIDAARRASARTINVIMPYFGYARSDRKTHSREPIVARLVANMLESQGVKRLMTFDLHADQIQGFFDIPVDHLVSLPDLGHYFYENNLLGEDLVVVAPGHTSVVKARKFAELLHAQWAVVDRRGDNKGRPYAVTGNVTGKRAILLDDIIDTGESLVLASEALKAAGVISICAVAPHAVLSGDASIRLEQSAIEKVIVTNTIEVPEHKYFSKLVTISVSKILAEAIRRVDAFESIESLLKSSDNEDVVL